MSYWSWIAVIVSGLVAIGCGPRRATGGGALPAPVVPTGGLASVTAPSATAEDRVRRAYQAWIADGRLALLVDVEVTPSPAVTYPDSPPLINVPVGQEWRLIRELFRAQLIYEGVSDPIDADPRWPAVNALQAQVQATL